MAPRVTEEHVEARKHQILDAAARSIAKRGFRATTMQDIADEAGLSAGAFYRYFASKPDIIEAIAEEHRSRNEEAFAAVDTQADTPVLFRDLATIFYSQFDDPEFAGCVGPVEVELWAEAIRNPAVQEIMEETTGFVLASLATVARAAQARGDVNKDLDPESVAMVWMSSFIGLEVLRSTRPQSDVWSFVETVLAMSLGRFWEGRHVEKSETLIDKGIGIS